MYEIKSNNYESSGQLQSIVRIRNYLNLTLRFGS